MNILATPVTTISATVSTEFADKWSDDRFDGPPFPMFLFPLFWLVVIGAVTTAVLLTRRSRDVQTARRAGETRLAERYASGEIGEQEYEERLGTLRRSR